MPLFNRGITGFQFVQSDVIPTISGLFGYWNANNVTLTGGTTLVSMPNISGSGTSSRNLVNASSVPVYNASDTNFNNQPSISSTTANQRLATGTFDTALAQPYTVYQVMRVVTNSAIMFWRTNGGNFTGSMGLFMDTTRAPTIECHDSSGNSIFGGSLAVGNYVSCCIYNSIGVSGAYFNNSTTAFMISPTNGALDSDSCTLLTIGNFTNANTYSWTSLAAYSGAHTQTQRQQVMSYLGGVYGITTT